MTGTPAFIAAIVAGLVTVLTVMLNNRFARPKQTAETESVQVKSTLEFAAAQAEELGELRGLVKELRHDVARLERRERLRNTIDRRHEMWDYHAMRVLREHSIDLGEPPSLDIETMPDASGPRTRAEDFGLPGTRRQMTPGSGE